MKPGFKGKQWMGNQMWVAMPYGKGMGTHAGIWGIVPQWRPRAAGWQGTNGAGKKRKWSNASAADEVVEPLDAEMEANISAFLEECGGTVTLGKLTTVFSGLKKKRLEQSQFAMCQGDADSLVSLPGTEEAEAKQQLELYKERAALEKAAAGADSLAEGLEEGEEGRPKKRKKEKDANEEPPEPLSDQQVKKIKVYLQKTGGQETLGRLATAFSGLKKAQLADHFELAPGEKDTSVQLRPEEMAAISPLTQPRVASGKRKKSGAGQPSAGQPMPALAALSWQEKVQEIAAWLSENNGSQPLGKLSTLFPGVKKAQLLKESMFEILPPGTEHTDEVVRFAS